MGVVGRLPFEVNIYDDVLIPAADGVQQRLAFVSGAMSRLLGDEDFLNLLWAEGLTSMPALLDPGKNGGELR